MMVCCQSFSGLKQPSNRKKFFKMKTSFTDFENYVDLWKVMVSHFSSSCIVHLVLNVANFSYTIHFP